MTVDIQKLIDLHDMDALEDAVLSRDDFKSVGVKPMVELLIRNLDRAGPTPSVILASISRNGDLLDVDDKELLTDAINLKIESIADENFFFCCEYVVSRLDEASIKMIVRLRNSKSDGGEQKLRNAVGIFLRNWERFYPHESLPKLVADLSRELGFKFRRDAK